MIRRAVARTALPPSAVAYSFEKLHGSKWLRRPRPEAIEREPCRLLRFDIDQGVIVLFLGRLALPVKIRRIIGRHLDAGAPRKDWVLLGATTAQHQILYPVYFEDFSGVDVPVEYGHLHVLGIGRDHLVRIVGGRDGTQARPGKHRV